MEGDLLWSHFTIPLLYGSFFAQIGVFRIEFHSLVGVFEIVYIIIEQESIIVDSETADFADESVHKLHKSDFLFYQI